MKWHIKWGNLFKKKVNIYTAIGHNDYLRIANKLVNHGIKYSTKSPVDARTRDYFHRNQVYDIYVAEEDEQKAVETINSKDCQDHCKGEHDSRFK
jgi:hypothetical protein